MEANPRIRAERREVAESRERILAAAESFFVEQGIDAPLHRLAEEAGVGVATLFRRFPNREELVRALYDRAVDRVDATFARVRQHHAPGWPAIVAYATDAVDLVIGMPLLPSLLQRMAQIDADYRPGDRWVAPLVADVELAKAAGDLREDATGFDIAALLMSIGGFVHLGDPVRRMIALRHMRIALDGLRAPGSEALPPVVLDLPQFHRAAHGLPAGPASDGDAG